MLVRGGDNVTLRTEYTYVRFVPGAIGASPGRWVAQARLRGEIRLGYVEYSTQFNRVIFVSDKAIYDVNYLTEILYFINQLEEQKGLIN